MVSFDPNRPDLAPYGFSCKRWAPAVMQRADRHNEIELNFLTEGWITYLFGGKLIRIEPRRLVAFWAAVPHQIVDHGSQAHYFVVTVPLGWFLSLRLPERFVQALVHGQVIVPRSSAQSELELARLMDWEQDFGSFGTKDHKATFLEIEAQIRRLSALYEDSPVCPVARPKRANVIQDSILLKAERMAHIVATRFTERIDTVALAEELDLPPKQVLKLFHMVFGTGLFSFITEYRIYEAQRLLVTSNLRVVDISEESGFGSLGGFNWAFRELCGCSPRDYRKRFSLKKRTSSESPRSFENSPPA